MELLNVVTARAVWLFDIRELNPSGKSLMPDLLDWLKETYSFEKAPESVTDTEEATKALAFERGTFQVRTDFFVDVELKIYSDGLMANTLSSTLDADKFLETLLKSSSEEFRLFYKPEMITRKLHTSELHLQTSKDLVGINPRLSEFADKISHLMPEDSRVPFRISGLSLYPTESPQYAAVAPFLFERKLEPLSRNKYFSRAPLHTSDHLDLLNKFESIFMS